MFCVAGNKKQRGLTLVELVVIAVVIVILGGILFPVFESAKSSPRRMSCLSNMKQLDMGLLFYQNDNNDFMPKAAKWADSAHPYIEFESVYRCPAIRPEKDAFGHAFYSPMSEKKTAKLPNPAGVPILFDSTDLSWNANGPLSLIPPAGRHPGGISVVAFLDGHARSFKPLQLFDYLKASGK